MLIDTARCWRGGHLCDDAGVSHHIISSLEQPLPAAQLVSHSSGGSNCSRLTSCRVSCEVSFFVLGACGKVKFEKYSFGMPLTFLF